ncbi:MAG: hypothetical protein CVU39_09100 [Chloroflexi bacterium HGW-Chloroflexi-10]|nr:MAG: hypothetical protein CVU39_09100 [Chloroflexi bacterium HGW-Chloroflexi-10]
MCVFKYLAVILLILLAACGPVPAPNQPAKFTDAPANLSPTQTTLPPSPTLRPATDFVEGINEVPVDKYLFVEYWRTWDGSGNCTDAAMIDFPGYDYSSGELYAFSGISDQPDEHATNIIGFIGDGDRNQGAMGGGISSELSMIQSLPYTIKYQLGTIFSVYRQGAIVVELWGQTIWLEPGQSWVQQVEEDPSSECHRVTTYRFTNYGFLDREQVQIP